jgi:hypothetical protein
LFSRIVNAFFVRAADDLVDGDRGFDKFFEETAMASAISRPLRTATNAWLSLRLRGTEV